MSDNKDKDNLLEAPSFIKKIIGMAVGYKYIYHGQSDLDPVIGMALGYNDHHNSGFCALAGAALARNLFVDAPYQKISIVGALIGTGICHTIEDLVS